MKPVEIVLRKVTKENDGRYEFNQNRLKAHIEMSQ
jgi:hypothetical protein